MNTNQHPLRDTIGQALSDYMADNADEGAFSIDPFASNEVDALAEVVIAALGAAPPVSVMGAPVAGEYEAMKATLLDLNYFWNGSDRWLPRTEADRVAAPVPQPGAPASQPAAPACDTCFGTGVEGDADDYGRTIDVRCGDCNGTGRAAPVAATQPAEGTHFQQRIHPHAVAAYGAAHMADVPTVVGHFFEEAAETAQAAGMTEAEAHRRVTYTFARPVGELPKEIGSVMTTLAYLATAKGVDMHAQAEADMLHISKPEVSAGLAARHARKVAEFADCSAEGAEPVAVVKENPFSPEGKSDELNVYLPVGTKLFTAPVAVEHPDAAHKPMTHAPEVGSTYWRCLWDGVWRTRWRGDAKNLADLARGVAYATEAAARAALQATKEGAAE